MLDIKFVRESPDLVKKTAKDKGIDLDVDRLLEVDERRSELHQQVQELNRKRNDNSNKIKALKGKPSEETISEGRRIKEKLQKKEDELRKVEKEFEDLMMKTPTIPAEGTPVGESDKSNVEIRKNGEIPRFDFDPKNHIELARKHDLIDFEKGVKASGFRGYYLKNEAVLIQMGLMMVGMKRMMAAGYTPFIPPTLVREFALWGTGFFPFGQDENYEIKHAGVEETGEESKERLFLAGTAEVGLGAYFADEILGEKDLPKKVCGFSPCYRKEIGNYGKDTRGIYRIHEFMKIEQFVICEGDYSVSEKMFEELLGISEKLLQDLKLPYRVVNACTGDMGAGKYKMYDIETYMPSRESKYGETHSVSNLGDWQARRLNIKSRTKDGEKKYVHTLNNTMIASPRILIAIFENYQQKDGSIKVPKLLVPYVGKEVIGD